jgi:H+-translocating NAD(P) transhydrogenase subunit alpha
MLLHMRTMLPVLALNAALAAIAIAQAPPPSPTTAPATQGAAATSPQPAVPSAATRPDLNRPPVVPQPMSPPAATQPATTQPVPTTLPATRVTKGTPRTESPANAPARPPAATSPAIESPGAVRTQAVPPAQTTMPAGKLPAPMPVHAAVPTAEPTAAAHAESTLDFWSMVFVFMLATFIGLGIIRRVSRLLHTPLMSLTNAISAIAVVGSIMLAGGKHYPNNWYHFWGAVALFASMTNIVSGFLITDRMLKMFKTREGTK